MITVLGNLSKNNNYNKDFNVQMFITVLRISVSITYNLDP